MSSDDDSARQPPGRPKRSRPQKPAVTIDVAANPPQAAAPVSLESAGGPGDSPEPPAGEAPATQGVPAEQTAVVAEEEAPPAVDAAPSQSADEAPAAASPATPAAPDREPPPPYQASAQPSRLLGLGLAGLTGAVAAIVIVLAIEASGILPAPGKAAADAAAAKAESAAAGMAALEARIATLEQAAAAADGGSKDLTARLASVEAAGKATGERIGKVETTLAARPQTGNPNTDQVLDDLIARLDRVEASVAKGGGSPLPPAGTADLEGRVAALESSTAALSERLAAVQARPPAEAESAKAARALAIGTLRRAAEDGAAFAGELAMLQALGLDETDIAALRPLAEKGAPPKAELAETFPEVADRLLAASAAVDPNAGFFDRLAGFARGLITVRPTSPIPGETPDAIVSRMQAAVDRGDLAAALTERDALSPSAKAVSAAWAQGAVDRIAIDRLVEKLSSAAGAVGN